MLRRQQAAAVIAARQKIVDSVVGMAEMPLGEISRNARHIRFAWTLQFTRRCSAGRTPELLHFALRPDGSNHRCARYPFSLFTAGTG